MGRRSLALAALVLACAAPAAAATGPSLAVDAGRGRHRISPLIYGLNYADPKLAKQIALPVDRWGGNAAETYNWQVGASNTGSDYFFENIADCWDGAHGYCSASGSASYRAYRAFVAKDRAAGAKTLLTLPMLGYVAKDAPHAHPLTCSFTAAGQDAYDPYDAGCGNGEAGGSPLASDPTAAGVAVGPQFAKGWIADLRSRYGRAAKGGVGLYELGNEPALWNSTHRDFHPAATTYDELWQKSRDLALAVEAADPGARTIGPSEWGWLNYFCSAADVVGQPCSASAPDRAAHGGTPLVPWYLQRMHAYARAHGGKRLLDYLDLHYYPQGTYSPALDVTRPLWDRSYVDPSWIGQRIWLIPRMRAWVAQNYPGTKLAISEYNMTLGDVTSRTAVLAEADALGIFAREDLDLATEWAGPGASDPEANAFRIYRNYDGRGHRFGSTWVRSRSGNQARLAVYAAERSAGTLTVLVVNKTAGSLTSHLALSGARPTGRAGVWRWAGGSIARVATRRVRRSGFSMTYPARSLTLVVFPAKRTG